MVDTRPWIFGRKVLPAGVIARVDPDEEKVYVGRTGNQIKATAESHPGAGLNRDDRTPARRVTTTPTARAGAVC